MTRMYCSMSEPLLRVGSRNAGAAGLGYWKKAKKNIEPVLEEFDRMGWRIEDPPTYYTVKCPCPARHMRQIHLTPSDPRYPTNALSWLRSCSCTKEDDE